MNAHLKFPNTVERMSLPACVHNFSFLHPLALNRVGSMSIQFPFAHSPSRVTSPYPFNSTDSPLMKRLKEMKQLSKDPNSRARAAKAEAKDSPISIKAPISLASGAKKGGFKKGGFKSAFAPVEDEGVRPTVDVVMEDAGASQMKQVEREGDESDWEGDDIYDPERPTGCHPGCEGWGG